MPENRGRKAKGQDEKSGNRTFKTTLERFAIGKDIDIQAREVLRDSPAAYALVKAGELTVGAAYATLEKTRQLQKQEPQRNSLGALRESNPALAEDEAKMPEDIP